MAANPALFTCPINTWVKVATNITVGTIYRILDSPGNYVQTIRVTTDPAPTDNSEAAQMFIGGNQADISSDTGIDVYVMALGRAGKVRVDL